MRRLSAALAGAALAVASALAPATADEGAVLPLMLAAPPVRLAPSAPAVHVKPPELFVPADAKPGAVSRTIRPFGAWTLICDDDRGSRRRVCMVSQTLVDDAGGFAFGWSLAGTGGGAPVLILRAPARPGASRSVGLAVPGAPDVQRVALLDQCSGAMCVGYLPVDPAIGRAIRTGARVTIATDTAGAITASFAGLAAAIDAIR